jgi:hypothetical protein
MQARCKDRSRWGIAIQPEGLNCANRWRKKSNIASCCCNVGGIEGSEGFNVDIP